MSRSLMLTLFVPLLLPACSPKPPTYEVIEYPVMTLSQPSTEFGQAAWGETVQRSVMLSNAGGMPMGMKTIEIGLQMDGNFTVSYNVGSISCPEADPEAEAKDTGGGGGDDSGGGGGDDSGGGGDDTGGSGDLTPGALFVLDPGCEIELVVAFSPIAIGDVYGALVVESVQLAQTAEEADKGLPAYLRDPIHWKQVVYLHGDAEHSQGTLLVRPRSYDFGYVDPGASEAEVPARIQVSNVGDGDITLTDAVLSDTCDAAFSIVHSFAPGMVLAGGDSTLVEVAFTPTDTDPAFCQMAVTSDDPASPDGVDVTITGNTGDDPDNEPPSVYIRSPESGYRYNAIRPLEMEINIFDVNQPASTLVCRVKSAVLGLVTIADCGAADESGHVFVEIPTDSFETGSDTLLVTVTDGSQTSAYASIAVVVNADYPASDDDGDGFGVEGDAEGLNADCDDDNPLVYPEAAEVYDGVDNDCDITIDEGTIGFDDDGDGYSEIEGDCNDYSNDAYPAGPERGDGMDNDCDGSVDEGTTLVDDDGDGYAEVNNDCDDSDATISPSATEYCDGFDNDCDGLRDSSDGCVETDSSPLIIGKVIRTEQSACLSGEVLTLDALVYDADGQTSTYQWTDEADNTFDNSAAPVVNWTCPQVTGGGAAVTVYVVVRDPDANQDWTFEKIEVFPADNTELYEPYSRAIVVEDTGGCSTTGSSRTGAFWIVGAAAALLWRRRD